MLKYEVVENQSTRDVSLLKDLDADGDYELITKRHQRNGIATIYIKDGSDGEYQHNFRSEWLYGASLFYGDYDRNGIWEVYGLQYSGDSLFISGVEYPRKILLNRKFVMAGFADIESNHTIGNILSIREKEDKRLVLSVMGGYGAKPRKVCLYDFEKDKWTYSQDSIKAYQQFNASFDLDQDGVNEIVTWGRSPDNSHGGEFFSDQNSYIMVFDENLELKDWYKAKGLQSNAYFIVLGDKPYFILNHHEELPKSIIYSYQNLNQASIHFKVENGERMYYFFSVRGHNYYLKRDKNATDYLVEVNDDFRELSSYAIPANLDLISFFPYLGENHNFLVFRERSTKELFFSKKPGDKLRPFQELKVQGSLLFSQGLYRTIETFVISSSAGDFFFDVSESDFRAYWKTPAAIMLSILTFFGLVLLSKYRPTKSKKNNSKILKINTRTGFEIIPLEDILYCKADGKYTAIQTTDNGEIISSTNLGAIEGLLLEEYFIRLSRSVILNRNFIRKADRKKGKAVFKLGSGIRELALTQKEVKELSKTFE